MKHVTQYLAASLLFVTLAACGGTAAPAPLTPLASPTPTPPLRIFVQPSDRVEAAAAAGYDAQIQSIEDPDDASMVARQAALGGPVILWLGKNKSRATLERAPRLMREALRYPTIRWVYLYDELFWAGYPDGIRIGLHEDEVLQGAAQAHANGLSTIVTILPDVILDPRFALKDMAAFDGISIDVYPSISPTTPDLQGCRWDGSVSADLFYCSAQKLRKMGYRGKIGYIYQSFGMHSVPPATLAAQLAQQRAAVAQAGAMGADAVMPWGMFLGAPEMANEPDLIPLGLAGAVQ